MKIRRSRRAVHYLLMATAAACAAPAWAQSAEPAPAADERPENEATSAQDIVVQAEIGYRNRDESAEPVLVYDTDYFQRFEPLTAGDALRRVPSVTFLADVIESDGARLRGLPPSYTQILINGERVPGSNADRSFFLDRIPAELIDRVEIVRSSSARRTGDAIAGTLNIELRDALRLDGGYIRAGGLYFNDEELEPSFGAVWGGAFAGGRLLLGANLQGRHNPKVKFSERYTDSPENDPSFATNAFDNREDQIDTRDGTDYSFNASYELESESTDLSLSGFVVRTDRLEDERSFEYDDITAITGPVRTTPPGNLLTDNANVADIDQTSYSLSGRLRHRWGGGETTLKLDLSRFDEDRFETEYEVDFDRTTPRFTGDLTTTDLADREFGIRLSHAIEVADNIDFEAGAFYQDKDRDTDLREIRNRFNLTTAARTGYDQFSRNPTEFATPFAAPTPSPGGLNTINEQRVDGYALVEGRSGIARFELGVRYEATDITINDLTMPVGSQQFDNDYGRLLPSASLRLDLTPVDRISMSAARTTRRPEFNFISPALLEAELGDNDLLGNPALDPETAWGFDIGYERRLGRTGVVGVNVFFRDVSDLVEVVNTGVVGSEGAGTFVLQPQNVGDGQVWGVEFDLSTDLGFIGLPDTGIFGNFSWLDSEISDFAGDRRFNGQSDYVFNVGFIQNLREWGAAFGVSYREQGAAFDRIQGEEIRTTYGGELEAFIEKRIGNNFTIRAVASNLLDGSKDEVFHKYTTVADQLAGAVDEYELETENAGPVFQIIMRVAF